MQNDGKQTRELPLRKYAQQSKEDIALGLIALRKAELLTLGFELLLESHSYGRGLASLVESRPYNMQPGHMAWHA